MSKNKKALENKRRQKTEKRAKRNKAYTHSKPKARSVVSPSPVQLYQNLWFTLHGLNYLNSDYESGTWKPLADIYSDTDPDIPSLQEVFATIHETHYDKDADQWTPLGKLLAGWCVAGYETMQAIRMALLAHLATQSVDDPANELARPHSGLVWEFFHSQIRQKLEGNP
jgi:hypothetical protein